jgi:hypothetical protein
LIILVKGNDVFRNVNIIICIHDIDRICVGETECMKETIMGCIISVNRMNQSNHLKGYYQLHPNHLVDKDTNEENSDNNLTKKYQQRL